MASKPLRDNRRPSRVRSIAQRVMELVRIADIMQFVRAIDAGGCYHPMEVDLTSAMEERCATQAT